MTENLVLKARANPARLLLALAFVAASLLIGYSLFPDSGRAEGSPDGEATATPHLPVSEDDISEDEVAGEEEGASGASCHTEAGMFTCDDRHDDTPTPTPTPIIASDTHTPTPTPTPIIASDTHTPTPTPTTTSSPGSGGGTTPDVPTGLTSAAEPGRISLDWNTVGNATGYEVYQWSGYESTEEWYKLPFYERPSSSRFGISFNGSSAVVSGVTEGVCYSHILRSKNGSRYSGWSSTISTCVPHSDPPPSTPTPTPTPTPSHYHTSCQRHSTNGFFIWHVHSVPGSSYLSDPCTPTPTPTLTPTDTPVTTQPDTPTPTTTNTPVTTQPDTTMPTTTNTPVTTQPDTTMPTTASAPTVKVLPGAVTILVKGDPEATADIVLRKEVCADCTSYSRQLSSSQEYVFEDLEPDTGYTLTATGAGQTASTTAQVITVRTHPAPTLVAARDNFYGSALANSGDVSIDSAASRQSWLMTYTVFSLTASSTDDYSFEFRIPNEAGFQRGKEYNEGCSWSGYTPPAIIELFRSGGEIGLLRCAVGDEGAKIKVMAWTPGVLNPWPYYSFTVAQGWHRAASTIRYEISTSMSTSSTSTASLIREAMPVAVPKWNNSSAGVTFCKDGEPACNDYDADDGAVTIRTGPSVSCDQGIACLPPGGQYPHTTGSWMIIEESPCVGMYDEEVCYEWTNDDDEARTRPLYVYLPGVIMHELGHAAGLGHSSRGGSDLMRAGIRTHLGTSSYDQAAMRRVLDTSHTHPHSPGE